MPDLPPATSPRFSRRLNLFFRFMLVLALGAVLYSEVAARDRLAESVAFFLRRRHLAHPGWLLAAVGLMPLNWLAETLKWHQFIRRYEPISLGKALCAVLAGLSVSLFTPNRIGEYGGRMLFISPENQWKAVIANLVGNFAQFLVLLTAGLMGMLWCLQAFTSTPVFFLRTFFLVSGSGLAVLYVVYFNIDLVAPIARRIPKIRYVKRFVKNLGLVRHFTPRQLSDVLTWAVLRYGVYSLQYWLLLRYFDIQVGLLPGLAGVAALFLVQTSLPLPPVAGLLTRGNLAVHLWGQYGANEAASLAATLTLWILNVILPALLGTFFLFRVNIAKSLGYEDP